jgi:hypothetical protein
VAGDARVSDLEIAFHKTWLGMVQPTDGLVVSVPVLVAAQCMRRLEPSFQHRFVALCPEGAGGRTLADLESLFAEILDLPKDMWDRGDALPADLCHYVPEGQQTIRPTLALRRPGASTTSDSADDGRTAAARAAEPYVFLVWDLPPGLELDKPETTTGPWHYPPSAKFDRLLRHCRSPIGLLSNRRELRLIYAPHGESSGTITFRVADMASVGGRPILEAFVMLLSGTRWFGVAEEHQLPALLRESRLRQANVTNALAAQVFEALQILLAGFEAAGERDGHDLLRDALTRSDDHLYGGLLTVLLRLVFLLYAEDRGLMPVDDDFYAEHLSLLQLYEQLQRDQGLYPDSMSRRYGAWDRLVSVFRSVFLGVKSGDLHLPPRRGDLFDPHRFPFLEGWGPGGSAPITLATDRAAVRVPSVDDGAIYEVLHRLLVLEGQRLSYRTLDVEQIGSVYEALMGYHVVRLEAPAVCLRPLRVWVSAREILAEKNRDSWLQEQAGLAKAQAKKLAEALKGLGSDDEEAALVALEGGKASGTERAGAGRLVLQPGTERRRTSSHYTPRSLSEPIVRRTLEPLLAAMKPLPTAKGILELKICDPAMGSGAFLVETCRFLADRLVEAWTREGQLDTVAAQHPDVVHHARRLIAQRCLYGVDKNPFAVGLAKLSLWLATLAKELPFTFLDHALRCGDSLVGLSFEQICEFNWASPLTGGKPKSAQFELFGRELEQALAEAIGLRQRICDLAGDPTPQAQREKERLLGDADDAMDRVRLAADVCVGAFFAADKDKSREAERERRRGLVEHWLRTGEPKPPEQLELQAALHDRVRPFHWGVEFPEVFHVDRPDPLEGGRVNKQAWMDAFLGNPPFMGGSQVSGALGDSYRDWLLSVHSGAHGNADYCAHFFRRCASLLGKHGTIGLIATNTISQGDTRATGLQTLLGLHGYAIYEAIRTMPWPGDAAVEVSVVHLARGEPTTVHGEPRLDGRLVPGINSMLRGQPERAHPSPLRSNERLSFHGCKIYGQGFLLPPEERALLVSRAARNAERVFPYIGGEEINNSPAHAFERYVINFGTMSLSEAERWPDLIAIVRERVKPERDSKTNNAIALRQKEYWWRFRSDTPQLREAVQGLTRCLVTARVTKHLCFSFQPTNVTLNEKVVAFPFDGFGHFALMQSRVHVAWAWLLSSTMKTDLNYSPSDCFETFPFPTIDPRCLSASLDTPGERLYSARAKFMIETQQGLTKTYNLLKSPTCRDPAIVELRQLHEDLDRAVLAAYRAHAGWPDIAVPPYGTPTTPAEQRALEAFEDNVIDRLFHLNAERAAGEAKAAAGKATKKKSTAKKKTAKKPASAKGDMFESAE